MFMVFKKHNKNIYISILTILAACLLMDYIPGLTLTIKTLISKNIHIFARQEQNKY